MPFSYSNTVMFANPTVSSLKYSGGVSALASRQARLRSRAETIVEVISQVMILLSASPAGSTGSAVALRRFGKIAEATEFFVALFQQLIDRDFEEALQVRVKCLAQNFSGFLVIAVRAAIRL